jgi:hypothetical protein
LLAPRFLLRHGLLRQARTEPAQQPESRAQRLPCFPREHASPPESGGTGARLAISYPPVK